MSAVPARESSPARTSGASPAPYDGAMPSRPARSAGSTVATAATHSPNCDRSTAAGLPARTMHASSSNAPDILETHTYRRAGSLLPASLASSAPPLPRNAITAVRASEIQ